MLNESDRSDHTQKGVSYLGKIWGVCRLKRQFEAGIVGADGGRRRLIEQRTEYVEDDNERRQQAV